MVICFGVISPERLVVDYDVGHQQSVHLDTRYLASLSDDAVPAMTSQLLQMDRANRDYLRQELSARPRVSAGWAQKNLSGAQSNRALNHLCG